MKRSRPSITSFLVGPLTPDSLNTHRPKSNAGLVSTLAAFSFALQYRLIIYFLLHWATRLDKKKNEPNEIWEMSFSRRLYFIRLLWLLSYGWLVHLLFLYLSLSVYIKEREKKKEQQKKKTHIKSRKEIEQSKNGSRSQMGERCVSQLLTRWWPTDNRAKPFPFGRSSRDRSQLQKWLFHNGHIDQ